jgi:hypothetical protein
MPNLGHVTNLVAGELHHVDVVSPRALASGWDGAWPCMRAGKDTIGRDVVAFGVGGEGFDLVAAVWQRPEQALHPVGVLRQRLHLGQRLGLRRKSCVGGTIALAAFPAFARLAGVKKLLAVAVIEVIGASPIEGVEGLFELSVLYTLVRRSMCPLTTSAGQSPPAFCTRATLSLDAETTITRCIRPGLTCNGSPQSLRRARVLEAGGDPQLRRCAFEGLPRGQQQAWQMALP